MRLNKTDRRIVRAALEIVVNHESSFWDELDDSEQERAFDLVSDLEVLDEDDEDEEVDEKDEEEEDDDDE